MTEYKRTKILDKYFALQIFECPIEIVIIAATLGARNVTIENYHHYRNPHSLITVIKSGDLIIEPKLKQFSVDFTISQSDFISLKKIWATQGCYAIFHESDTIKFKATDLTGILRYKALDNFKWTLEIAIPDGTSGDWGQIVSPDQNLIDQIENHIRNFK
jgi:hypothetical protein